MNKSLVMKISYCVVALLVAGAIIFNSITVPVIAAEVESLPAFDSVITSSYDDSYIYVNDNGIEYSIPRDTVASGSTVNSYPWSKPNTLEVCALGSACPVSYWYSPSNQKIVVVSSSRTVGNENVTYTGDIAYSYVVRSYSDNQFYCWVEKQGSSASGSPLYVTVWDCVANTRYAGNIVYRSNSSDKSFYFSIDDDNGGVYDDLVCIYSSYSIDGFYGGSDEVITPDYYFDYQYLFYTEQKGYVFVDSSNPLNYISNSSDPTKAILFFDDECNKHVYTSELGNSWIEDSGIYSMYGSSYTMDYSYFYASSGGSSCYVLVYSNDDSYEEEPLLTPDYIELEDIVDDLFNYNFDDFYEHNIVEQPIDDVTANEAIFDSFLLVNGDYMTFYEKYFLEPDYSYSVRDTMFLYAIFSQLTDEISTFSYVDDEGYVHNVSVPSLRTYIQSMAHDFDDSLVWMKTLHSDLKSVFDNITNTNSYLYDIRGLIQDMPDYSKSFDKLVNVGFTNNQLLDDINNNILALGSGSGEASPDAGGGSSSTSDVLDNIDFNLDKLSDYFVADNGAAALLLADGDEQTGTNAYDTFQDFLVTIDDEILTVLYGIAEDVDDDDIIDDIFDTDDEDNEDYWLEVSTFVKEALAVFTTNSVLTMAYTYAGSVTDGIGWLNARVDTFYNSSDVYKPVITLGAILFLVSVYLRKGGY